MKSIKLNIDAEIPENSSVFKKCKKCGIYFKSILLTVNSYCNEHQDLLNDEFLSQIKNDRYIDSSYFDVYNDIPYFPSNCKTEKLKQEYLKKCKNENYGSYFQQFERICRICGSRLLSKKGNYDPKRRFCIEHQGTATFSNWSITANNYKYDLWKKQGNIIQNHIQVIKCENCNQDFNIDNIQIHHKIEVNTLNLKNLYLLWDYSNLIALCESCHYLKHAGLTPEQKLKKKLKKKENYYKKFIPLDKFFKN